MRIRIRNTGFIHGLLFVLLSRTYKSLHSPLKHKAQCRSACKKRGFLIFLLSVLHWSRSYCLENLTPCLGTVSTLHQSMITFSFSGWVVSRRVLGWLAPLVHLWGHRHQPVKSHRDFILRNNTGDYPLYCTVPIQNQDPDPAFCLDADLDPDHTLKSQKVEFRSKNYIFAFLKLGLFVNFGQFSCSWIRIPIHNTDPDPGQPNQWGSTTLHFWMGISVLWSPIHSNFQLQKIFFLIKRFTDPIHPFPRALFNTFSVEYLADV